MTDAISTMVPRGASSGGVEMKRRAIGLFAMLVLASTILGACSNKGVPKPEASASQPGVESAAAADAPSAGDGDAEQAAADASSEAPRRKGVRTSGGIPPIRRADLISGITVPGGQRFHLGGDQPSSFYCDVENQGETEVMVTSTRGLGATVVARLRPGDSASHRFQPTEAAVIANLDSTEPAKVRIRVWGDTNLAMRYEPSQP